MWSRLIERLERRLKPQTTQVRRPIEPKDTEQGQDSSERDSWIDALVGRGLGDHYEADWGDRQQAMARVCCCGDSSSGMALRIWGSDIIELFVTLRDDLRCVAVMTRRQPGESGETLVGVPCGVLGDPHLLLHEDASDAEIQSLTSHGGSLLDDGRSVSAGVVRYGSQLVLEVRTSDGPTVIIEPHEGSGHALSIEPGIRPLGGDPAIFERVLHVWVPEHVFGMTSSSPDRP